LIENEIRSKKIINGDQKSGQLLSADSVVAPQLTLWRDLEAEVIPASVSSLILHDLIDILLIDVLLWQSINLVMIDLDGIHLAFSTTGTQNRTRELGGTRREGYVLWELRERGGELLMASAAATKIVAAAATTSTTLKALTRR
jgi:hypothetical protein